MPILMAIPNRIDMKSYFFMTISNTAYGKTIDLQQMVFANNNNIFKRSS